MQGSWKRRGVVASFVVFLLAGSACGPKEATDRPGRALRARRRLRDIPVEEKVPASGPAELEESRAEVPGFRGTEEPAWPDVEPAAQPEEEVAAPAEEEAEAEPPVAEDAEDEGGEVEEEPADDDVDWE